MRPSPARDRGADLAPLALELALWGSEALPFLTPPPAPALAEARALLAALGALDEGGRITAHGRALAALPLHPRLAHMLAVAGPAAAPLAALMEARDPLRGAGPDLVERLRALERPPPQADRAASTASGPRPRGWPAPCRGARHPALGRPNGRRWHTLTASACAGAARRRAICWRVAKARWWPRARRLPGRG